MTRHYRTFTGHPKTKQNLVSEGEDAAVPGYGRWPVGHTKEILPEDVDWIDATKCFERASAPAATVTVTGKPVAKAKKRPSRAKPKPAAPAAPKQTEPSRVGGSPFEPSPEPSTPAVAHHHGHEE